MLSETHKKHITARESHAACPECKADGERGLCPREPWQYKHVSFYLAFARAGLAGKGVKTWWAGDRLGAAAFRLEFQRALIKRIYLKGNPPVGRKLSGGYLERLATFRSRQDGRYWAKAAYLRDFAKRV